MRENGLEEIEESQTEIKVETGIEMKKKRGDQLFTMNVIIENHTNGVEIEDTGGRIDIEGGEEDTSETMMKMMIIEEDTIDGEDQDVKGGDVMNVEKSFMVDAIANVNMDLAAAV